MTPLLQKIIPLGLFLDPNIESALCSQLLKRLLFIFIFYFLLVATPVVTWADTSRFSILPPYPATNPEDFVITLGTPSLEKGDWWFFSEFNYSYHPLEFLSNGSRTRGIVDHLFVQYLGGAYVFSPLLETEIDVPIVWVNRFSNPNDPTSLNVNKAALGDVFIRNRLTLFNEENHPFGFGFVQFLTIPMGSSDIFVGDRRPTAGLMAMGDIRFSKLFSAGVNVGFNGKEEVHLNNFHSGSLFLGSLGINFTPIKPFKVSADIYISSPLNALFEHGNATSSELLVKADYAITKDIRVNAGGGFAVSQGAGVPQFRTMAGITYQIK